MKLVRAITTSMGLSNIKPFKFEGGAGTLAGDIDCWLEYFEKKMDTVHATDEDCLEGMVNACEGKAKVAIMHSQAHDRESWEC